MKIDIESDAARRKNDSTYLAFIESAPDLYFVIDVKSAVVEFANDTALEKTGYTRQELVGSPMMKMHPEAQRQHATSCFQKLLTVGSIENLEFLFERSNGTTFPVLLSVRLIGDSVAEATQAVACVRDITHMKALEQLEQRTRKLEMSNSELAQFAYAASHDLKAPIREIASFAHIIAEKYDDVLDDEGRKYLSILRSSSQRAHRLIGELLEYATLESDILRTVLESPVEVGAVIEEVMGILRLPIEESGAKVSLSDDFPTVQVDSSRLKRVFQSLISNGLKFIEEGKAPQIKIEVHRKPNEYQFDVSDNGIGIDAKHHERIFRLFHCLHPKNEYEGTGLGLAMCRRIVEAWGGRIWLDSEAGKGSTFSFSIPR